MPHLVAGAPAALQGVGDSVGGVQGVWGVWGVQGVQGVGDGVQGGIAGRRPLRVFLNYPRGRRGVEWGGLLEPNPLRKVLMLLVLLLLLLLMVLLLFCVRCTCHRLVAAGWLVGWLVGCCSCCCCWCCC